MPDPTRTMVNASSNGMDPDGKSPNQNPDISRQLKKAEPAEILKVGQVVCELLEIMVAHGIRNRPMNRSGCMPLRKFMK